MKSGVEVRTGRLSASTTATSGSGSDSTETLAQNTNATTATGGNNNNNNNDVEKAQRRESKEAEGWATNGGTKPNEKIQNSNHNNEQQATTTFFDTVDDHLDRLTNRPLQEQRFTPSAEKSDYMGMLELKAKVDRALDRRLSGQDAVLRPAADRSRASRAGSLTAAAAAAAAASTETPKA